MNRSDYLKATQRIKNTGQGRDYCLSSNQDQAYLDLYSLPPAPMLNPLLSQYLIGKKQEISRIIQNQFKVNQAVLGTGSEDLIVRSNQVIKDKKWPIGVVLPSFYRIWESLNGYDYVHLTEKELQAGKIKKLKTVWLLNPNPFSGKVKLGVDLIKLFNKYPSILFLVDEASMFLLEDWQRYSLLSKTNNDVNFVVFASFSKLYGLSGMRAGFASGNQNFLTSLKLRGPTFPLTNLTIYFLKKALENEKFFDQIRQKIQINKQEIETLLTAKAKTEVSPSKTNCVFARTTDGIKLYQSLLEKGVIGLDLDSQFGMAKKGLVRLTAHSDKKLHQLLINRIKKL